MYPINRYPVIIISETRTGSTMLAEDIKQSVAENVVLLNEPLSLRDYKIMREETSKFLEALKTNSKFILKCHAHNVDLYPTIIKEMIANHNCYLIRIRRKDFAKQVRSNYIEQIRNIWGYYSINPALSESVNGDYIQINEDRIRNTIKDIRTWNSIHDNMNYEYDLDLWYEEINYTSNTMIKTPRPANDSALLETIQRIINEPI